MYRVGFTVSECKCLIVRKNESSCNVVIANSQTHIYVYIVNWRKILYQPLLVKLKSSNGQLFCKVSSYIDKDTR